MGVMQGISEMAEVYTRYDTFPETGNDSFKQVVVIFSLVDLFSSNNRDLKILDTAAFKNAVTSERAWVVTATFAREIRALRFALCKRSPKHITTNRFSQRITGIAGGIAAMTSLFG